MVEGRFGAYALLASHVVDMESGTLLEAVCESAWEMSTSVFVGVIDSVVMV